MLRRGNSYSWNPVYWCPAIQPKIPEIPAIGEIRPKLSENRLYTMKIPEILGIGAIPERKNLQIRLKIP